MLLEVPHESSLSSVADAEALFRALRIKYVNVRNLRPEARSHLAKVLSCLEPKREHALSFEGGSLAAAENELHALVLAAHDPAPFGYFDLRTPSANLRIWPARHSPTWLDRIVPQEAQSPSAMAPCWVERPGCETLYPATLEETFRSFMEAASGGAFSTVSPRAALSSVRTLSSLPVRPFKYARRSARRTHATSRNSAVRAPSGRRS